jgi:hypothetical protein
MTNSELAALELQARIMGWEPAVVEHVVIEVPRSGTVVGIRQTDSGWRPVYLDEVDFYPI